MLRVAVGESQPTGTAVGSKQRRGRVKAAVGNDGKTGEAHGSPSVQQGLQKLPILAAVAVLFVPDAKAPQGGAAKGRVAVNKITASGAINAWLDLDVGSWPRGLEFCCREQS